MFAISHQYGHQWTPIWTPTDFSQMAFLILFGGHLANRMFDAVAGAPRPPSRI